MTNIFKKAMEVYDNMHKLAGRVIFMEHKEPAVYKAINKGPHASPQEQEDMFKPIGAIVEGIKDHRYNEPKGKPKATEEQIDDVLESTEIYRQAKEHILKAQRGQIAYGIDKYPEPLNADTWTILETIDHIIDEDIDKMHYQVMLRIKLERMLNKEVEGLEKEFLHADDKKYTLYHDGVAYPNLSVKPDSVSCNLEDISLEKMDKSPILKAAVLDRQIASINEKRESLSLSPVESDYIKTNFHKKDIDDMANAIVKAMAKDNRARGG